jgi:hypothetical protein
MAPGNSYTKTFTLSNNTTQTTKPLNLTSTLNNAIGTLSWSAETITLSPNQILAVSITFTANATAPNGPFTYTTYING